MAQGGELGRQGSRTLLSQVSSLLPSIKREDYSFDVPLDDNSWAYDLLTAYNVPKHVRIRSASLKILYLVTIFVLSLFIIVYTLLYKLEFMTSVPAYGMATIEAMPPMENFWHCDDLDIDCNRLISTKMDGFCKPSERSPKNFTGCQDVDFFSVTPASTADSAVVPTSAVELHQEQKMYAFKSKLWKTKSSTISYVPDPELWLLKIRHSYQSTACTAGCNSDETQGFMFFVDGEQRRMPGCGDLDINSTGCLSNIEEASTWKHMPLCGDGDAGSPHMCVSTSWGDYVTIGTLLEAAGARLDDLTMDKSMTKREGGLALVIEIHYVNDDPVEYWTMPFGVKWKYEYRVRAIAEKGDSDHVVSRTVESSSQGSRVAKKYLGITIRTEMTSSLRAPSWFHALVALALSASVLQVANIVVERVFLFLLRFTAYGQYLSAMFTYFAVDNSLPVSEFAELHLDGKLHEAKRKAELEHANSITQTKMLPLAGMGLSPKMSPKMLLGSSTQSSPKILPLAAMGLSPKAAN